DRAGPRFRHAAALVEEAERLGGRAMIFIAGGKHGRPPCLEGESAAPRLGQCRSAGAPQADVSVDRVLGVADGHLQGVLYDVAFRLAGLDGHLDLILRGAGREGQRGPDGRREGRENSGRPACGTTHKKMPTHAHSPFRSMGMAARLWYQATAAVVNASGARRAEAA